MAACGSAPGPAPLHMDADAASNMEDTVEFRLLMVYAARRRPSEDTETPEQALASSTSSNQTPGKTEQQKKKKKKKKKKCRGFKCLCPQTHDEAFEAASGERNGTSEAGFRAGLLESESPAGSEDEKLEAAVSRLTEISDQIPFRSPEIQEDSDCGPGDDGVEKLIGLLLRESGDDFNQKVLRDSSLTAELSGNYGFFERLVSAFLQKMGITTSDPDTLGPQASPKTKLAVICEVSSRLSAVDRRLSGRLLGFGATYIRHNFSSWAEQHGGYEDALNEDEDEE